MRDDLKMMRNSREWPCWPLLPLKRLTGKFGDADHVGFMFADAKPVVYLGNIFGFDVARPLREVLDELRSVKYENLETLQSEWRID